MTNKPWFLAGNQWFMAGDNAPAREPNREWTFSTNEDACASCAIGAVYFWDRWLSDEEILHIYENIGNNCTCPLCEEGRRKGVCNG